MANNCLVTTLKATIEKDLPELGVLEIELKATTLKCPINFGGVSPLTIKIKGSGHFYNEQNTDLGQEINNYNNTEVFINNTSSNDKVLVSSKYKLARFNFPSSSVTVVKTGAILNVEYLEKINSFYPYREKVVADIDTLGKYGRNLETLLSVNNTYLTGTIEKLTENICELGRTSGTLRFMVPGTSVTFNNNPVADAWWYIDFSVNGATIRMDNTQKATYNPSSTPKWTYI